MKSAAAATLMMLAVSPLPSLAGPDAGFERGVAHYFAGRPNQAIAALTESMPASGALRDPATYILGASFATIGAFEKAIGSLDRLARAKPEDPFAKLSVIALAHIFFDLEEYGAVANLAQTRLENGILAGDLPAELAYLAGQANYILERDEAAKPLLQSIRKSDPHAPFARFTLAQIAYRSGNLDRALKQLNGLVRSRNLPPGLRDRTLRMIGMVRYLARDFPQSALAFESIGKDSPLYAQSRIDMALAADSAGDSDRVSKALRTAIDKAPNARLRAEAGVTYGRLFTKVGQVDSARGVLENAIQDLRGHDQKAAQHLEPAALDGLVDELEAFEASRTALERHRRLTRERAALTKLLAEQAPGVALPDVQGPTKYTARSPLFSVIREGARKTSLINQLVALSVQSARLVEAIETAEREAAQALRDHENRKRSGTRQRLAEAVRTLIWLAIGDFDLENRFVDALAIAEKIDDSRARWMRLDNLQHAHRTIANLVTGNPRLPLEIELEAVLWKARARIETGGTPNQRGGRHRDSFREEWESDRRAVQYVIENLALKERQMRKAIDGNPLHYRNLGLSVLTTAIDWMLALERLTQKYRHLGEQRLLGDWAYSTGRTGITERAESMKKHAESRRTRARGLLRTMVRDLIEQDRLRTSLVIAQAEQGLAEALDQRDGGR